jgi:hypothetical protein
MGELSDELSLFPRMISGLPEAKNWVISAILKGRLRTGFALRPGGRSAIAVAGTPKAPKGGAAGQAAAARTWPGPNIWIPWESPCWDGLTI